MEKPGHGDQHHKDGLQEHVGEVLLGLVEDNLGLTGGAQDVVQQVTGTGNTSVHCNVTVRGHLVTVGDIGNVGEAVLELERRGKEGVTKLLS